MLTVNKQKNFYAAIFAAFIGTALEFYDYALFGFLTPIISKWFFPQDSKTALLLSYGIFGFGFLVRPMGGLLYGYIGDMYGRRRAMLLSIFGMVVPTTLIGLIPGYHQIGFLAPILLILCRLTQGLSVGGEFSGAAIFVIEHARKDQVYFAGSLVTASSVVGMLLGSTIAYFSILESSPDWGWRIPYILSLPIGLIGFYIRKHTQETAVFNRLQQHMTNERIPILITLKKNCKASLITFGIGSFIGILYYIPFVFMTYYHTLVTLLSPSTTLSIITLGLGVYIIFLCLAGCLADKYSPQKIMLTGIFSSLFLAYPIFWLINLGSLSSVLLGEILLAILAGTFIGPANGLTASLFEARSRCRGVAFSLGLGISVFGGGTPMALIYAIDKTQIMTLPSVCIIMGSLIALISVLCSIQSQRNNLLKT